MSVAEVIDNARSQGRTLLTEVESKRVLHEGGIPVAPAVFAPDSRAAVQAAEKAGFPVVMKVVSPDVAHKSDVGGVRLGLESKKDVRLAFDEMMAAVKAAQPAARIEGAAVQRMAPAGTEEIIWMRKGPPVGPGVVFWVGGGFFWGVEGGGVRP